MHILILGATGRVGRRILEKALADGHVVTVLVRSLEKLTGIHSEGLTILQGDARNGEDLHTALRGVELVISCLGTDGGTVLTEFTPLLIEAMQDTRREPNSHCRYSWHSAKQRASRLAAL